VGVDGFGYVFGNFFQTSPPAPSGSLPTLCSLFSYSCELEIPFPFTGAGSSFLPTLGRSTQYRHFSNQPSPVSNLEGLWHRTSSPPHQPLPPFSFHHLNPRHFDVLPPQWPLRPHRTQLMCRLATSPLTFPHHTPSKLLCQQFLGPPPRYATSFCLGLEPFTFFVSHRAAPQPQDRKTEKTPSPQLGFFRKTSTTLELGFSGTFLFTKHRSPYVFLQGNSFPWRILEKGCVALTHVWVFFED